MKRFDPIGAAFSAAFLIVTVYFLGSFMARTLAKAAEYSNTAAVAMLLPALAVALDSFSRSRFVYLMLWVMGLAGFATIMFGGSPTVPPDITIKAELLTAMIPIAFTAIQMRNLAYRLGII